MLEYAYAETDCSNIQHTSQILIYDNNFTNNIKVNMSNNEKTKNNKILIKLLLKERKELFIRPATILGVKYKN